MNTLHTHATYSDDELTNCEQFIPDKSFLQQQDLVKLWRWMNAGISWKFCPTEAASLSYNDLIKRTLCLLSYAQSILIAAELLQTRQHMILVPFQVRLGAPISAPSIPSKEPI